jgi:hypothetical protein
MNNLSDIPKLIPATVMLFPYNFPGLYLPHSFLGILIIFQKDILNQAMTEGGKNAD